MAFLETQSILNNKKIPLSLYIHIPWCIQKCPYCDFNSHKIKEKLDEKTYINNLINDLKNDLLNFNETRPLSSIFIGGGTPSVFSGNSIYELIAQIKDIIPFEKNIEITIEANPGTADSNNFRKYFGAGINRISIGIQSFNNIQLIKLGRIHNSQEAEKSVKIAQDIGFKNINIDIMFGLINQTTEQAVYDIEKAISLNTNHISYYQLTIEPQTLFAKKPPKIPNQDNISLITDKTYKLLNNANFSQYEVSAWGKNHNCKHNLNYWKYGDYLGIGAGAHGKITKNNKIIRTIKYKNPKDYANNFLQEQRTVLDSEKAFEFMLNTMRLKNGFDISLIKERGLFEQNHIINNLEKLYKKKLITKQNNIIKPTSTGYLFLNNIIEEFL